MSEVCVVAVDVGNTNVKLCVRREDSKASDFDESSNTLEEYSVRINQENWHAKALNWVQHRIGCRSSLWRIASVHRVAAEELAKSIRDAHGDDSVHPITRTDVPMPIDVDEPDRLGIDRLLSAYAANRRFKAPLVVVDAGSAVTVDWVNSEGVYCGGAILPGLRLQSLALASGTDALSEIDLSEPVSTERPGKNTVEAIRQGIVIGVAGGIQRLADDFAANLASQTENEAKTPLLVITGGDAATIIGHLRGPFHHVPNLVCRGLLDLAS